MGPSNLSWLVMIYLQVWYDVRLFIHIFMHFFWYLDKKYFNVIVNDTLTFINELIPGLVYRVLLYDATTNATISNDTILIRMYSCVYFSVQVFLYSLSKFHTWCQRVFFWWHDLWLGKFTRWLDSFRIVGTNDVIVSIKLGLAYFISCAATTIISICVLTQFTNYMFPISTAPYETPTPNFKASNDSIMGSWDKPYNGTEYQVTFKNIELPGQYDRALRYFTHSFYISTSLFLFKYFQHNWCTVYVWWTGVGLSSWDLHNPHVLSSCLSWS